MYGGKRSTWDYSYRGHRSIPRQRSGVPLIPNHTTLAGLLAGRRAATFSQPAAVRQNQYLLLTWPWKWLWIGWILIETTQQSAPRRRHSVYGRTTERRASSASIHPSIPARANIIRIFSKEMSFHCICMFSSIKIGWWYWWWWRWLSDNGTEGQNIWWHLTVNAPQNGWMALHLSSL